MRLLTARCLKRYIDSRLTELNLENQIHQCFQVRAVKITPNPY